MSAFECLYLGRIEARLGEMEATARGVASGPWEWEAEDGLNDPAAVLRMVAGLRAIVALHHDGNGGLYPHSDGFCATCEDTEGLSGAPWPCPTLLAVDAMFPATPAAASEGGVG